MVYDSTRKSVILFGGRDGNDLNDTWELTWNGSNATWTKLNLWPSNLPSARSGHSMVYDSSRKSVILFGGYGSGGGNYLNDIWFGDNATWTEVNVGTSTMPSARSGHTMVYDSTRKSTILFGGYGVININGTTYNDTWTLSFAP
jgi:hypothetical protein